MYLIFKGVSRRRVLVPTGTCHDPGRFSRRTPPKRQIYIVVVDFFFKTVSGFYVVEDQRAMLFAAEPTPMIWRRSCPCLR